MFYFQLKKKKKKKRDRDFSIISVGRERAIKQVFFLGLIDPDWKKTKNLMVDMFVKTMWT